MRNLCMPPSIGDLEASKSGCTKWIKNLMAIKYRRAFEQAKQMTLDEFNVYQREKLKDMVIHCVKHVPYYRRHRDQYLRDGKPLPLEQLPVLAKSTVRENASQFYAENGVGRYCQHTTSGTSGTPLAIRMSYRTHALLTAGFNRYYSMFGLTTNSRLADLGNFVPIYGKGDRLAWRDYVGNRLFLNIHQINDERASEYADILQRYQPVAIYGYASSVYFLASAFQRSNLEPPKTLRVVLTSCDILYPHWRERISEVFGVPVSDQYGSQEGQCLATECPQGRMHINPEHGIVEIVDEQFQPLTDGGEGEILLTGLGNDAMPLIRYAISDRSSMAPLKEPCSCGLQWPVIQSISGRTQDAVYMPDGRPIVHLHSSVKPVKGIIESQFIQDAPAHMKILLVVDDSFASESEETIRGYILRRAQCDFKIDFEYVDRIPRGPRGKFRSVVNLVPRQGKKNNE